MNRTMRCAGQRASSRRRILAALVVTAGLSAVAGIGQTRAHVQGCGVQSVLDLCSVIGREPGEEERLTITEFHSAQQASMLEVLAAGRKLGLPLAGYETSFIELMQSTAPSIVHLGTPAHFLVLVRSSDAWVQLADTGFIIVAPRDEIEARYSGHALILDQSQFPDGGPRLELPEFHYPFGIAGVGQKVEHAFEFRNTGDEDLTISPQASGCGGPAISVEKEDIAPGESTHVTVSFTIGYSGDVMKSAKLLTTDPTQPVVFLTLHGRVPHDLRMYPDRMHIAEDKGACPTRSVTITGPAEMDITEVDTEHGLLLTQLGEPAVDEDEKKSWTLQVSLKDESFVGMIEDTIRIKTTHPERPLITIPVTGVIRGDLRIDPPSVFFGFVKPGAEARQEVVIQSRSGAEFTVTGVECRTAGVTVGAPQERQDGAWAIPVSVDTAKAGVVDGAITVTTDVKGEETLTIPVYAHVAEGE